jgi:carbon-monoxide dehydrogenase medium subunit
MQYHEPHSVDDAVALLSSNPDSRCLAGGATLVAMMNAELVSPSALVNLRHLADLVGIEERGEHIRIGAMTTHSAVAAYACERGPMSLVTHAASQIAHKAIRDQGTIGGSIAHGDPNADFPTALVAADASIEIAGPTGRREVASGEFFLDYLETALEAGELVTAILVPTSPKDARSHYLKLSRVDGDFATVSVGLLLSATSGICDNISIAIGSCGPKPIRLDTAEQILTGSSLDDDAIKAAAALLVAAADPIDDVRGSSEYRYDEPINELHDTNL